MFKQRKINKKIGLLILLVSAAVGVYLLQKQPKEFSAAGLKIITLSINGYKFKTEVAQEPNQRSQGLSGRDFLCQECALLFVFEQKDRYSFWMKEMKFDLDILWLDGDRIVQIDKYVPYLNGSGETRRPQDAINRVLEINAGESDRLNIKEGDKVDIK